MASSSLRANYSEIIVSYMIPEALKEVLGVSCSSNFVRDFLLEESVWLGHLSSVNFSEPSDSTWAHNF